MSASKGCVTRLSFVRRRPRGKYPDCWAVEPTGDYRADCERGTDMALEFLEHQERGGVSAIGAIVRDMVEKGDASGLMIGFVSTINDAARAVRADAVRRHVEDGRREIAERNAAHAAERLERARHAARARWAKKAA